jgi:hypothetical protein
MTEGQEHVRLRAREGEAVEWTRRVAHSEQARSKT